MYLNMIMRTFLISAVSSLCIIFSSEAQMPRPSHLMTDLLEHTDVVFMDGHMSSVPIDKATSAIERYQIATICSEYPRLGWIMDSRTPNTHQTAYRILLSTKEKKLIEGQANVWDSGRVENRESSFVEYRGPALSPGTLYYWTVKIWDNHGNESQYASPKAFMTADTLQNAPSAYPLQCSVEYPAKIERINNRETFIAFDHAAFGRLSLTLSSQTGKDTVTVRLGEKSVDGRVYRKPADNRSSVRYAEYRLPLKQGTHSYVLKITPDKRNTNLRRSNASGVAPVLMPEYIGEVYPFRFCEIEGYGPALALHDIVRLSAHYPFNDFASQFQCSDTVLNKVWDLCKYTIKATSFAGIYVDGDRERIAYEADAIIGQLGHYSVDREFSMGRRSLEHLLLNPTWPTEWNLQAVLIAWNDFLYTGDHRALAKFYDVLKAKTLRALRSGNGLISTQTGKATPEFFKTINFNGKRIKDIIDWPQSGYVGSEKELPGEADGYKRTKHNTVVNSYYYQTLRLMAKISDVLGKKDDSAEFSKEAEFVKKQINDLLFNKTTGHYRDGIESEHESLHGNMFPLAFGIVPEENRRSVIDYIKSRRMACSVYGAQFLIDALYQENEGEYALKLLSSTGERSWYNMLRAGSTICMEAWDDKYKPNQDWNHIWGAAPANLIPRGLFGIVPLEPGFGKFCIKPQPGNLEWGKIKVPTIKGDIDVSFQNNSGNKFAMQVNIPANSEAEVHIPCISKKHIVTFDGVRQKMPVRDGFMKIDVGSGQHEIIVKRK